jgi:hypothetical protein
MRARLGGIEGNEILTSATALVLTMLLLAEGVTIVDMGGLLSAHMFIGLVLIPPVPATTRGRGPIARRARRLCQCGCWDRRWS